MGSGLSPRLAPRPLLCGGRLLLPERQSHQLPFGDFSSLHPVHPPPPIPPPRAQESGLSWIRRRWCSLLEGTFQSRWGWGCPTRTCSRWVRGKLGEQPPADTSGLGAGMQPLWSFCPDPGPRSPARIRQPSRAPSLRPRTAGKLGFTGRLLRKLGDGGCAKDPGAPRARV